MLHSCILEESQIDSDPLTNFTLRKLPFLAYSPNGSVTGDLIYVNYGLRKDYLILQSLNITLQNKIGIVRYGKLHRGTKVRLAQEFGIYFCWFLLLTQNVVFIFFFSIRFKISNLKNKYSFLFDKTQKNINT